MQAAPNPLLLALSVRAAIHHDRGEALEAARAAADCAALIATLEPSDTTHMATATLASLHATDDPERCLRESRRGRARPVVGRPRRAGPRPRRARARAASTTPTTSRETRRPQRAVDLPLAAARAETGTAEVLLARGERGRRARWPRSPPRPRDAHAPARRREARLVHGRALAAAGQHEAAKAVLQRVAADAARGGAVRLRNAASRELRALGTRISANGRRARAGRAERARARDRRPRRRRPSNKQVAATLYLSEKTIENALTRVYAKLGVRTRAQLARGWVELAAGAEVDRADRRLVGQLGQQLVDDPVDVVLVVAEVVAESTAARRGRSSAARA